METFLPSFPKVDEILYAPEPGETLYEREGCSRVTITFLNGFGLVKIHGGSSFGGGGGCQNSNTNG